MRDAESWVPVPSPSPESRRGRQKYNRPRDVYGRGADRHVGWSYPSGPGTWNGIFYPSRAGSEVRELATTRALDTVEVNSSFYRSRPRSRRSGAQTPRVSTSASSSFRSSLTGHVPEGAVARAGGEETSVPVVTGADVDAFRQGIDPLPSAGKLGALLVQFPPSFRHGDGAREYLTWLMRAFSDYPLPSSFGTAAGATMSRGCSRCCRRIGRMGPD